jgi:hypothetical protein
MVKNIVRCDVMQSGWFTLPDRTASHSTWHVLYQLDRSLRQYIRPSDASVYHNILILYNKICGFYDDTSYCASCRLASGTWIQAFRSDLLSPSPVLEILNLYYDFGSFGRFCVKRHGLMSESCPVLYSHHPPPPQRSQGEQSSSFLVTSDQTRETDVQCFSEEFSSQVYVFTVQLSVSVTTQ